MTTNPNRLEALYRDFDEMAEGRAPGNRAWNAHEAILDRLASNIREAEGRGWTSCALERAGGMGRLRACGIRPSETGRRTIPDWEFEALA
jgi:hypothetical protein